MIRASSTRDQRYLQAWSRWTVRNAQAVLGITLLVCALLIPLALQATQNTVPDGWLPDSATAVQVQQYTAEQFGRSDTTYYLLFSDPASELTARDRGFVDQVQFVVRPLRAIDGVDSVLTWGTTRNDLLNSMLISEDGMSSLAVISLYSAPEGTFGSPEWLRANLGTSEIDVHITGLEVVGEDFRIVGHNDLVRAELIALPITLVLLFFIFRGFVAALIPVALATGSMIITLATMAVMARFTSVSVFTVNTVTMLGLAVGIDYALIMVSRYREEIEDKPVEEAIVATISSAGKTVLTAASTVAIGLSGLIFFDVPAATSTAMLGALVVLAAMVLSIVAVPAALAIFSDRIAGVHPSQSQSRILTRIETVREHHPVATLLACIALLSLLTAPVLGMNAVSPGITNLPATAESRQTTETIQDNFPLASTSPIEIVIQPRRGSMLEATNLQRYQDLNRMLATVPGVQRVESLWSFIPAGFTASTLATSFMLEPDLATASQAFLTRSAGLITVIPNPDLTDAEAHELVQEIRRVLEAQPISGITAMVGGAIALDLDLLQHISARTPIVLGWILTLTALTLFLHLRSALLPLKAITLNLISMGASFGMLVWIFQDGNLAGVIGAEANGTTVMLVPVLMFCFLFGLGMDFEIIMLSRIRESWQRHGDTTLAVREGLHQAAGIVTASAVLMLTVFLAFAFSELDVVKALGIGLAIAVVIDATVVRMLLLPATMQLMGRWNWWPSGMHKKVDGEPVRPTTHFE